MYDEVSEKVLNFERSVSADEQVWLRYLTQRFQEEYRSWERDRKVWDYLDLVEDRAYKSPMLKLIGHAYLHIAYDLPRVIADSLLTFEIPHDRAGVIFDRMDPMFTTVFTRCSQNVSVVGRLGYFLRFLNVLFPAFAKSCSAFVRMQRKSAWINAQVLVRPRYQRADHEESLWCNFTLISRKVMHVSQNPITWLTELEAPSIATPRSAFDTTLYQSPPSDFRATDAGESAAPNDFLDGGASD